jgi:hypothetical protein
VRSVQAESLPFLNDASNGGSLMFVVRLLFPLIVVSWVCLGFTYCDTGQKGDGGLLSADGLEGRVVLGDGRMRSH